MGAHTATPSEPQTDVGWWARWGQTEPVRRALWPVAVALVGVLVGYGALTDERAALWLALASAALTFGGAEVARSYAWAPATVTEDRLEWQRSVAAWQQHADDEYERGLEHGQQRTVDVVEHDEAPPTRELSAAEQRPSPRPRTT